MTENPAYTYAEEGDYGSGADPLDIVTAYKSLKLAMSKNLKGLGEGREQCQGKGYLKPTMASR